MYITDVATRGMATVMSCRARQKRCYRSGIEDSYPKCGAPVPGRLVKGSEARQKDQASHYTGIQTSIL